MLKIFNTLSRKKEEFEPRVPGQVKMFVCGPTVYDHIHIGNARTFVFFDVLAKYLSYLGFKVEYIQNITDIDDKIIEKAKTSGEEPLKLAERFEKDFINDITSLGITSVSKFGKYARASKHIDEVIHQVEILKNKGHAYFIENDGWYFDIKTFADYGKLSGRTVEMADDAVSRIDENPNKRNRGDFSLWKLSKPDEPSWPSELGQGRPGWHIEDTAITENYFGPQYDIHGGGQDLIFPHHEAEIAQQESASGLKPFVKYWLHTGFLINNNRKMSKSKDNFTTLRQALELYSPQALRFYFLSAHYRSPLEMSQEGLKAAEAAVSRIGEFLKKLKMMEAKFIEKNENSPGLTSLKNELDKNLWSDALSDDLNTSEAFSSIFSLMRAVNILIDKDEVDAVIAKKISLYFRNIEEVFGIVPPDSESIPKDVEDLVSQREQAREDKDFQLADELRKKLESLGYEIDDTGYGPLLKPRKN